MHTSAYFKIVDKCKISKFSRFKFEDFSRIFKFFQAPYLFSSTPSRALKFLFQIQAFSRISQAHYEPWKQETVSGSGISWAICKSAPCSRQITTPAPHHSVLQARCPSCHPTNSVKALLFPVNQIFSFLCLVKNPNSKLSTYHKPNTIQTAEHSQLLTERNEAGN